MIAQPPDGRQTDTYIPDPMLNARLAFPPAFPPSQPQAPAEGDFRRGPRVIGPTATKTVEPVFTEEARRRKIGGSVMIEVIVTADGEPRNARVTRSASLAYTNDNDRKAALSLDQKAIEAVMQYQFNPGTRDGQPVPTAVNIEVTFQIY